MSKGYYTGDGLQLLSLGVLETMLPHIKGIKIKGIFFDREKLQSFTISNMIHYIKSGDVKMVR